MSLLSPSYTSSSTQRSFSNPRTAIRDSQNDPTYGVDDIRRLLVLLLQEKDDVSLDKRQHRTQPVANLILPVYLIAWIVPRDVHELVVNGQPSSCSSIAVPAPTDGCNEA